MLVSNVQLSQDKRTGQEFTPEQWGKAEAHSSGIVFDVGRQELQALLPEGYIIDPDVQPTVLHEILNMRKIPWLAGRGVDAPVSTMKKSVLIIAICLLDKDIISGLAC